MFEMRATATFNRGRTRIRRGDVFNVETQAQMRDYQSRGLAVLVKEAPKPKNKMAAEPSNKASPSPAGGEAQPSSASPPARRSRRTTASASVSGEGQAGT